ncbi:hypothetical protein SKA34_05170 [Photobacterium sp. SKA34]|nr:hypothetical protein SKA34_05170 [Photobacterium sp. SKA34]
MKIAVRISTCYWVVKQVDDHDELTIQWVSFLANSYLPQNVLEAYPILLI